MHSPLSRQSSFIVRRQDEFTIVPKPEKLSDLIITHFTSTDKKSHKRKIVKAHSGLREGMSTACKKGKCRHCYKTSCSHHCHPTGR